MTKETIERELLNAVRSNDLKKILTCLKNGASIETRFLPHEGFNEATPLHLAACYSNKETIALLLEQGAKRNALTANYYRTPAQVAHDHNHPEINRFISSWKPGLTNITAQIETEMKKQTEKAEKKKALEKRIEKLENALNAAQTSLQELTLQEQQRIDAQERKKDNKKNTYEYLDRAKGAFRFRKDYESAYTLFGNAKRYCKDWQHDLVAGDAEFDTATNLLKEIKAKKKEAKNKINPPKNEAENNTTLSSFSQ